MNQATKTQIEEIIGGFSKELLERFTVGAFSTMTNNEKVGAITGLFAKHITKYAELLEQEKAKGEKLAEALEESNKSLVELNKHYALGIDDNLFEAINEVRNEILKALTEYKK